MGAQGCEQGFKGPPSLSAALVQGWGDAHLGITRSRDRQCRHRQTPCIVTSDGREKQRRV